MDNSNQNDNQNELDLQKADEEKMKNDYYNSANANNTIKMPENTSYLNDFSKSMPAQIPQNNILPNNINNQVNNNMQNYNNNMQMKKDNENLYSGYNSPNTMRNDQISYKDPNKFHLRNLSHDIISHKNNTYFTNLNGNHWQRDEYKKENFVRSPNQMNYSPEHFDPNQLAPYDKYDSKIHRHKFQAENGEQKKILDDIYKHNDQDYKTVKNKNK